MLEVFLPGPWTWPAVGILALALKALSRPLPGRAGTGAVSQP